MDDPNWWVIGGILLDVVGAFFVVVPELDIQTQYKIYRYTPYASRLHRSMLAFYAKGAQVTRAAQLRHHLSVLWPVLQRELRKDLPPFARIIDVSWTDTRASDDSAYTELRVRVEGSDDFELGLGEIGRVRDYLARWYRRVGVGLLVAGAIVLAISQFT